MSASVSQESHDEVDSAAQPDLRLVERVLAGETALYGVLVQRYNRRLYRCARSVLKDADEAEDVVQQAYVSAFEALRGFRGDAALGTWLTRIVFHEALRRLRSRRRARGWEEESMAELSRDEPVRSSDPEHEVARLELGRLLESAVDALPDHYRVVVVLRDIEQMSTEETAHALELTEENVRIRLHRGRGMLRDALYERAGSRLDQVYGFDGERCRRMVAAVLARVGA